jgi:hypothetical protein
VGGSVVADRGRAADRLVTDISFVSLESISYRR